MIRKGRRLTAHSGTMTGFTQLADGFAILEALELARQRNEHATGVDWSALDRHVIDKGDLQIFPLARAASDTRAASGSAGWSGSFTPTPSTHSAATRCTPSIS